eukprot:5405083-Amphidinium_carterae.1
MSGNIRVGGHNTLGNWPCRAQQADPTCLMWTSQQTESLTHLPEDCGSAMITYQISRHAQYVHPTSGRGFMPPWITASRKY